MAKVNERFTVADAMELKTGDFVEVRFGRAWHRAQLTESPAISYRMEGDVEKTVAVLHLSGDAIASGRYFIPDDPVRMDGYCREALKEELQYVRNELMEDPSDLCHILHEPTWEEHRAAVDNVIECAVERIMKRMGL